MLGRVNLNISEIVAGSTVIPSKGRGQTVQIVEVHAHPDFDPASYTSDIALLKVSPPLKLDDVVRAIAVIDPSNAPKTGDPVYVTGWGKLSVSRVGLDLESDQSPGRLSPCVGLT